MNLLMIKIIFIITILINVVIGWDFAVTTKNRIHFYNDKWWLIKTAANQFDELSAITFDETEEKFYFNDQDHQNGSIFSLKLSLDDNTNDITENILSRTKNETIAGIAFDPLDRVLYWTDATDGSGKIYSLHVSEKNVTPVVLLDLGEDGSIPIGIAVDVCRRKLYWTNSNHKHPSIERSQLDGSKREIIVNSSLYQPQGITVDQFSDRVYWVDDRSGSHFSVESSNLDGKERHVIYEGQHNVPYNLAVTRNSVFWTDKTHRAVWNIFKTSNISENPPIQVQVFSSAPRGIIAKVNFLTQMANDVSCKDVVKKIKTKLIESREQQMSSGDKELHIRRDLFCLNKGEYNPLSGRCICKIGFTGVRCETDSCHNFCVHGTCDLSSMGFPKCTCQEGFYGERCESYKCSDYCHNGGKCEIRNNIPTCICPDEHSGSRCERNITEMCSLFCEIRKLDPDRDIPFDCYDVCDDYIETGVFNQRSNKLLPMCSDVYNKTVIFVTIGILTALTLVFLIIHVLRRLYKPARPRIKKTFVVQKKVSQTPLTSRPVATEQCEITIENCCNMNICDTPCFDPKLLQQNMTFEKSVKEDKKILINHLEEDLY